MNLMIMGWAVALGVVSLILRHGAGAEALAWSVLFGLTPFSAVFYPVAVLPRVLQPIALALPSAHVFEGMRGVLLDGVVRWDHLIAAFALNAVWLAGARMAVRPPVPPGPAARRVVEHRRMIRSRCAGGARREAHHGSDR